MLLSKPFFISSLSLLVGFGAGTATSCKFFQNRQRDEAVKGWALHERRYADTLLTLISLLDKQEINAANKKLNFELAYRIYFAKMLINEPGVIGSLSRELIEKSALQMKRPEYQTEEAKVIKEIAEYDNVLVI